MSNYQLKRAAHRAWPQPTMPSAQAVGVLPATLLTLVAVGLLALAIMLAVVLPTRLHPALTEAELRGLSTKDRLEAQDARRQRQDETRSMLLQALGALVLLTSAGVGAWLT